MENRWSKGVEDEVTHEKESCDICGNLEQHLAKVGDLLYCQPCYDFENPDGFFGEMNDEPQQSEETKYPKDFKPPFRVGRKQQRAVLDANGRELVVFPSKNYQAQRYVDYLNGKQSEKVLRQQVRDEVTALINMDASEGDDEVIEFYTDVFLNVSNEINQSDSVKVDISHYHRWIYAMKENKSIETNITDLINELNQDIILCYVDDNHEGDNSDEIRFALDTVEQIKEQLVDADEQERIMQNQEPQSDKESKNNLSKETKELYKRYRGNITYHWRAGCGDLYNKSDKEVISAHEILEKHGCPEVPFSEHVVMYYPSIIDAMQEYAEYYHLQKTKEQIKQ